MTLHLEASTLDDLLKVALETVLSKGEPLHPSKGATIELFGCSMTLLNPRARLSRTGARGLAFSTLAELCWYLSGSDDVSAIAHYVPRYREAAESDGRVHGAYGPRLFEKDGDGQLGAVIDLLRNRPTTRQAVVQIFDKSDLAKRFADVPCTCTMQFLVRQDRLQMIVYMRSNDVFMGFPHDVFAFTMIQEIVARSLGIEVGRYTHMVGSLHVYAKNLREAEAFLREGWQPTGEVMPPMPVGDPWPHISELLALEASVRSGHAVEQVSAEPYWADLGLLLEAFSVRHDSNQLAALRPRLHTDGYWPYLREKMDRRLQSPVDSRAPGSQEEKS